MYSGDVLDNGTATGMFGDLQQGKFDAILGHINTDSRLGKHFGLTVPWFYDNWSYCAKNVSFYSNLLASLISAISGLQSTSMGSGVSSNHNRCPVSFTFNDSFGRDDAVEV